MTIQEAISKEPIDLQPRLEKMFAKFPKLANVNVSVYSTGQIILSEGSKCDTVFILLSGSTCAYWLEPGISQYNAKRMEELTVIGDLAVLADSPVYTTSIKCTKRCRLLSFSRQTFERWMECDLDMYRYLVIKNIRMLMNQAKISRKTSMEHNEIRVLGYLYNQYVTGRLGTSTVLKIKDRRDEIVENVGAISLRTLNRYLSHFKDLGLISTEKGKITINQYQFSLIGERLKEEERRKEES